ncbi:prepilin peptidase [Saccharophagus degradans]|uniref:prepilin peptidase n=1 Tax=Saccharophagus degradans TaxID=86304 RepID=UPI003F5EDE4A
MPSEIEFFEQWLFILLATAIIGATIGSFLNVVIYRLPLSLMKGWELECKEFLASKGEAETPAQNEQESEPFNIAFPASHCPSCKAPVKAWQNIPIISYLLLKGKCAACNVKISLRYPIVEFVTSVLSVWVVYSLGLTVEAGLVLLLTWSLLVLTLIDVDHQLLPDNITLPLLWLGLLANSQGHFTDLQSAVIGAVAGYLVLWSVFWLFKLVTGKEGMGFGDFKLLAALGAWMGWQALPVIIILSSAVGAIIGIGGILIFGKDKNKPIPFGPYLAIAGWIAFFWGDAITGAYLSYATGQ